MLLLIIISLTKAQQGQTSDKLLGNWINETGAAKFEFFKTGSTYQAKIIWMKEPADAEGHLKTDKNNPDSNMRNRPIVGLIIIKGLQLKKEQYVDGTIYSPEKGVIAKCSLKLQDDHTLDLTVSKSFFTYHKTWKRL